MQTLYYTTGNFIRHTGNVVDLTEYRRRLAQAASDFQPEEPLSAPCPSSAREGREVRRRRARSRRSSRLALFLDGCASMGVVVMTLTFTAQLLF